MDFVSEQLLKHRRIVAHMYILETVYAFYLSRSLTVLFLRLFFYVGVLYSPTPEPPAVIAPPSGGTRETRTEAGAPSYDGTTLRQGTQARGSAQASTAAPARAAALGGDAANARGPARPEQQQDEEEDRKGSMIRKVVLIFALAIFNDLVIPLVTREWSWYWHGPGSTMPDRARYSTDAQYTGAVATAFTREYGTWRTMLGVRGFYVDFLAAEEPPPNFSWLLGNPNVPLFLPLLDVINVLLQLLLLAMTFPKDFSGWVAVVPMARDDDDDDEAVVLDQSGGTHPHTSFAHQAHPTWPAGADGGDGSAGEPTAGRDRADKPTPPPRRPPPAQQQQQQQQREDVEASGSTGSDHSLASSRSRSTQQRHGREDGLASGGGVVRVDMDGGASKVEPMELEDTDGDEGEERGGRGRDGRALALWDGLTTRPLAWFAAGGGLISGTVEGKALKRLTPALRGRRGRPRGSGGGRGGVGSAVGERPVVSACARLAAPSLAASLRGLWVQLKVGVRAGVRQAREGWSWTLITVEVPPAAERGWRAGG